MKLYLSQMGFVRYKHLMTTRMKELAMTGEARLFYRASCRQQDNYIKAQLNKGIDPPKINLGLNYIKDYFKNNDLAQRDMDLIAGELMEAGVVE